MSELTHRGRGKRFHGEFAYERDEGSGLYLKNLAYRAIGGDENDSHVFPEEGHSGIWPLHDLWKDSNIRISAGAVTAMDAYKAVRETTHPNTAHTFRSLKPTLMQRLNDGSVVVLPQEKRGVRRDAVHVYEHPASKEYSVPDESLDDILRFSLYKAIGDLWQQSAHTTVGEDGMVPMVAGISIGHSLDQDNNKGLFTVQYGFRDQTFGDISFLTVTFTDFAKLMQEYIALGRDAD